MTFLKIEGLGNGGLGADLPGWAYPPNVLTTAMNVRCADGILDVYTGAANRANGLPAPATAAFALREQEREQVLWILNDGTFYSDMGGAPTLIPNNAGAIVQPTADQWTCAIQAGLPYFSHINQPMVYLKSAGAVDQSIELAPYSDTLTWDDRGVTAALIRSYKQFLVAANGIVPREIGGTEVYDPRRVSWSAAVLDTKTAPYWSTDPVQQNGTIILGDMKSAIIEIQPLRDTMILYGTEEAQVMRYIGGQQIMRFDRLPAIYGALGRNCAVEFAGQHFVVGQDDLFIHDGQTPKSLGSRRVQRLFFQLLDTPQAWRVQAQAYISAKEVWVFFPARSAVAGLTHALIWNWEDDTMYARDLLGDPDTQGLTAVAVARPRGALGEAPPPPPPGDDTYDGGDPITYDAENQRVYNWTPP